MMQQSTLRSKLVLGLVLLFAIFIFVYLVVLHTYATLSLTPNSPESGLDVGHIAKDGEIKDARGLFGVYMIPRSSDSLVATSSGRETRVVLTDRPIVGVQDISVDLAPQKQLSKVGKDGQSCVGSTGQGRIFTYSCTEGNDKIFAFADKKAGQYENSVLSTTLNANRSDTLQYGDGILSLIELGGKWAVEYVNVATSDIRQRQFNYDTNDSVKIYANASTDAVLVVNSTSGDILHYSSLDTEPKKYTVPESVSYSTCGVFDSRFACAASELAESEAQDSHSEEHSDTVEHARIIMFDIETKKQTDVEIKSSVNTICLNEDGLYFKDADQVMKTIPISENQFFTVSGSVVSMSCSKNSLVYGSGSSFYQLTNGVSQALFAVDRFNISSTHTKGDITAFTTFIDGDEQATLHTYLVSDKLLTERRSEVVLPYEIPGDLPIFEMDYDDDTIYIKPHASITSDKTLGVTSVDVEALNSTKQTIEDRLRGDGLLERYKLVYYFN